MHILYHSEESENQNGSVSKFSFTKLDSAMRLTFWSFIFGLIATLGSADVVSVKERGDCTTECVILVTENAKTSFLCYFGS